MFEEVMAEIANAEAKKQREANVTRIFSETSGMIWDSISDKRSSTHANDLSYFSPTEDNDYNNEMFASHDDDYYAKNATSQRDDNYRSEKMAEDSKWTSRQADSIEADCVNLMQGRAAAECKNGELPNGKIDPSMSMEDCMQFWADGMPDVSSTHTTSTADTATNKMSLSGGMEVAIPEVGKVGFSGSAENATTDTDSRSQTASKTARGNDGFLAQCNKVGGDWFNQRMMALLPYSD